MIGLALLLFTIVGATNHALMYTLDVYKPVAAEVVAAVIGFKGIVGFGLSFGTSGWIADQGYSGAFGEMALISGVFLALSIPVRTYLAFSIDFWTESPSQLNIWGARIRQASFQWRLTSWIKWDVDRDDVAATFH